MKPFIYMLMTLAFLPQAHAERVILPDGNSLQTVGSGLIVGTDGSSAVILGNSSTWNDGTRLEIQSAPVADPYVPYAPEPLGGYDAVSFGE